MKFKRDNFVKKDSFEAPFGEVESNNKDRYDAVENDFLAIYSRNLKRKKILKITIFVTLIFLVSGGAFWKFYDYKKNRPTDLQTITTSVEIPKGEDHVFVNDIQGVIPNKPEKETIKNSNNNSNSMYTSEHYQIKDMAFGGNAILFSNSSESLPLKIENVRSEVLASKDGEDAKLLVTWKTNKLAQSEITYEKGTIKKQLNEGGFGLSHTLVLSDLERDTRYTFFVKVKDRWGNQVLSENHNFHTGKKPVSVFGLISEQMDQIFGWAIKK